MSTKVGTIRQVVDDLREKLISNEGNYITMGSVKNMLIVRFEDRKALSRKQAVRGGRLILTMNAQYLIISPESQTNCFYHTLAY